MLPDGIRLNSLELFFIINSIIANAIKSHSPISFWIFIYSNYAGIQEYMRAHIYRKNAINNVFHTAALVFLHRYLWARHRHSKS